jgi:hypothetical protein
LYETLKQTSCSPSSDDIQCEVSNWPTHIAAHLQAHKTPTQSQPAKELQFCHHTANIPIVDGKYLTYLRPQ